MTDSLIGQSLPNLSLPSTDGKDLKLPDGVKGHWTVLYFYPADDTPGCTKEACSYRDGIGEFTSKGAKVYGVSMQDIGSHTAFRAKYNLNFPLLFDKDHKLSEALGSYKGTDFASRDTFLIDKEGKIRAVWRKVDPTATMAETHQKLVELAG